MRILKNIFMKFISILFSFILLGCFPTMAQNSTEKLPVDPNVKIGKLSNGLTYYIRHNQKPEKKMELRLVVNAGSILEDPDQLGIAHFTEHMAFNGTKRFKKNDIVSFLQSIGVGFGNDLNAYTSFNETVYILPIPVDNPDNIEKGFQILEDWAQNVTFTDKDIDGERGVVLEESRLGKGAQDRMFRKIYPQIFAGSLYANRLPIGSDSIIKNQKHDVIRRFYKDWYRPNLMAVVVVGDIDVNKAEDLIKKYFSNLTNPKNERERFTPQVDPYKTSSAEVVTDKEATGYSYLLITSAHKVAPSSTLKDYKNEMVKNIFSSLFNQRLRELTQKENAPFLFASAGFSSFARSYESFFASISTGNSSKLDGLVAFQTELERVKRFGFLQSELDRAKTNMLTSIERQFKEKDKTESANYVDEYVRNFLSGEPIPGIENETKYYKELLPTITLEDVNAIAKSLDKNENSFIALTGPEAAADVVLPTSTQILAIQTLVDNLELKPYEEKVISSSLLSKDPKAGKITKSSVNKVLGTSDFVLSNGVTVTLKQTDFKNDQILISGIRAGGKNKYGLADKYNAEYMVQVMSSMGLGDFNPVDLKKALTGKTVSLTPTFGEISEGFKGSSSVKDVETLMQLIYLSATAPRKDSGLYNSFVQKNKAQLAFLSANPQVVFIDSLFGTFFNHNPLAPVSVPKPAYFDKLNLDRIMSIYNEVFGNANKMHFTVVGSISKEELQPLLEKYIAALPSKPATFNYVDNKVRPVKGKVDVNVYKGKDPKALIVAIYSGEVPYSESLELKGKAISDILNITIIEELREEIQGIYGGGTQFQMEKLPYSNYNVILQLPCGPEKVDTLLFAANAEMQDLIKKGPSKENLDKVKKQWLEKYKTDMKENGVWLSNLQDIYFTGENPDYFLNYEKYVNALTPKDIQDAAKILLSTKNVVTGILRPEKSEK